MIMIMRILGADIECERWTRLFMKQRALSCIFNSYLESGEKLSFLEKKVIDFSFFSLFVDKVSLVCYNELK